MTSYDKHVYELETLGFTIVENAFSREMVNKLKAQVEVALIEDQKLYGDQKGKNPDLAVDLTIHHPLFIQALDNDIMLEIYKKLLGANCILYSYTSTILRPGKAAAVHQMHVDSNKYIPNFITGIVMTLALDDFNADNGATVYLPGSQNLPDMPSEETFVKYCLPTNRKAGDALFFNPRVWHRAGNNSTDKVRYGITIYATRSYIKQRFDYPRMIPKTHLENLSEKVIEFLGYKATPPMSVGDYYKPAEQRSAY